MTWEQILAALAELPSIPPDADEQIESVLRNNFNFYDDNECEGHPDGPVMGETFHCDGSCKK